ncbi:hypothetical protein [Cohnella luojiensis]|uniref:Uncharacterized protein n=1 Tax=Cohnella luojiensis TaxID=652876 RepID=A0A4Y8LVL3_9BACL|nr:hypothetical protein [Cohnella luojiensis]TFE25175.1 hypothetical protein E2980_14055 [Cohnella luojiensis]
MIKPLLLFLIAYFLINGYLREPIRFNKIAWLDRPWVVNGMLSFLCVVVLSYVFNCGDFYLVLAAFLIFGAQYLVNITLRPLLREKMSHFLLYQAIQLSIVYFILLLVGRTGNPRFVLDQIHTLLFSANLHVEADLIVPVIFLILVFITYVASDIVTTFLYKYGNPVALSQNETAAALESISEDIKTKKQNFKNSMLTDMSVEEQTEVILEQNEAGPQKKTTESIKIQYQIQQTEDDSSKGKYIGILERILICVFVFYEIYQGLLLLGAMKTLARFKLFENKAFAEYYLIGTLLSLIIAMMCGFLLQRLLSDATWIYH